MKLLVSQSPLSADGYLAERSHAYVLISPAATKKHGVDARESVSGGQFMLTTVQSIESNIRRLLKGT